MDLSDSRGRGVERTSQDPGLRREGGSQGTHNPRPSPADRPPTWAARWSQIVRLWPVLRSRLQPVDYVAGGYLALTTILILLLASRLPAWPVLAALNLAGMAAVGAIVWFCEGRPGTPALVVRIWYPALLIPLCYREVPLLVPALWRGRDFDWEAAQYDFGLFGDYPTVWIERWYHPLAADLLQLVYFSFLALPLLLGAHLWFRYLGRGASVGRPQMAGASQAASSGAGRPDPDAWFLGPHADGSTSPRDHALRVLHFYGFVITLGFLSSYLGYLAVPIRGPHTVLAARYGFPLDGTWILREVRQAILVLEGAHWDCFPSGHTALMILMVWCAWHFSRPALVVLAPWGAALVFSTVYLRYHYVVDLIAGAILAGAVMFVAPRLFRKLSERRRDG